MLHYPKFIRSNPRKIKHRGFTITETLVATAVVGGVMAGAFSFSGKMVRSSESTANQAEADLSNQKFIHQFQKEMRNVVNLYDYTGDALSNPMQALNCSNNPVPISIVALPTYTFATIPENAGASNPWAPVNSTTKPYNYIDYYFEYNGVKYPVYADEVGDAIRYIYVDPKVPGVPLFRPGGPGTAPAPTAGDVPIIVEARDDVKWAIGDYGVIRDSRSSRYFRITDVDNSAAGQVKLYHSITDSHHNAAEFGYEFGLELTDDAYAYRAHLKSIVFDKEEQRVLCDDHRSDDGWDPSMGTFGSPGRVANWVTCAKDITAFYIEYQDKSNSSWRRNPASNLPSTEVACENQVGFPNLSMVRVRMEVLNPDVNTKSKYDENDVLLTKEIQRDLSPAALRNHADGSSAENLEGAPSDYVATSTGSSGTCEGVCSSGF